MSGNSLAIIAQRTDSVMLPDTDKVWTNRLQVRGSSGNAYTVAMRRTDKVWGCSCRGWIGHRKCKHLGAMLPVLLAAFEGSRSVGPVLQITSSNAVPRIARTGQAKARVSRLPEGEAERRAQERARATWSGEKYERVVPGSPEHWAATARAFINGDATFLDEAALLSAPRPTAGKKSSNPHLAALNLDEMPKTVRVLQLAYRKAVMGAFVAAGNKDTAPAYVRAFETLTKAFERVKLMQGW